MRCLAVLWAVSVMVPGPPAGAGPPDVSGVGWEQRPGRSVPADIELRDHRGRAVALSSLLGTEPLVVAPVYYRCPKLCSLTLAGLADAADVLAGDDARVVAFSFAAGEGPADAADAVRKLGRRSAAPVDEWHYLTGDRAAVARLTDALGFSYRRDPQTGQYAHPAGIVVLTPDGVISSYLFGVRYPRRQLAAAVDRAAGGDVGSPLSRLAMLCFDYDPATGRYTLAVMKSVRLGGALMVVIVAAAVVGHLVRERRRRGS